MVAEKIHITEKHTGKMQGMVSISTSCLNNPLCKKRCGNKESICSHCYSQRMHKRFDAKFKRPLIKNSEILSGSIIEKDYLPVIYHEKCRLESFGDLINEVHAINYFNICKKNKRTTFALWTKNPWLIEKAISMGHKKPRNLIIVYSSEKLNQITENAFEKYPFIDKVFTVYDKKFAANNNVNINCEQKCAHCLKCYQKKTDKYINEIIK